MAQLAGHSELAVAEVILVSPLTRALQTLDAAFPTRPPAAATVGIETGVLPAHERVEEYVKRHSLRETLEAVNRALEHASLLPPTARHLLASLGAAAVSCVVMNPVDVACVRRFHATADASKSGAKPPAGACSAWYGSLFRGLWVSLARTVPHTMLTLTSLSIAEHLRGALST